MLYLTLLTEKLLHPGLYQASIYFGQRNTDKPTEDKQIDVEAIMLPSFGIVTDQQLAYLPKMKVSDTELDLGSLEGKKRRKATVTIENLGTLINYSICKGIVLGMKNTNNPTCKRQ